MIKFFKILSLFFFGQIFLAQSQTKIEKEISYISDFAFNLNGGNRTGYSWLGCFQASLKFDTEKLKLWKNGKLKFSYISAHGKSFSELTGDIQVASNIEAGQLATTLEFWYQHSLGNMDITAGFIDLNAFFSYSELALSLINSSFGIQPTISGNMPVPIFPITSLGGALEINLNNSNKISVGIFDGNPKVSHDFQLTPNVNWNTHGGVLAITEYVKTHKINNNPGLVKAGIWVHTSNMPSHNKGGYSANYGYYLIGEQELINNKDRSLRLWSKFGGAPLDCNVIRNFKGAGISYSNFLGKNINDVITFGFAQATFCHKIKNDNSLSSSETVLEFCVKKEIGLLTLQPDFQYIIHPSGITELSNPLCFIFRTTITI